MSSSAAADAGSGEVRGRRPPAPGARARAARRRARRRRRRCRRAAPGSAGPPTAAAARRGRRCAGRRSAAAVRGRVVRRGPTAGAGAARRATATTRRVQAAVVQPGRAARPGVGADQRPRAPGRAAPRPAPSLRRCRSRGCVGPRRRRPAGRCRSPPPRRRRSGRARGPPRTPRRSVPARSSPRGARPRPGDRRRPRPADGSPRRRRRGRRVPALDPARRPRRGRARPRARARRPARRGPGGTAAADWRPARPATQPPMPASRPRPSPRSRRAGAVARRPPRPARRRRRRGRHFSRHATPATHCHTSSASAAIRALSLPSSSRNARPAVVAGTTPDPTSDGHHDRAPGAVAGTPSTSSSALSSARVTQKPRSSTSSGGPALAPAGGRAAPVATVGPVRRSTLPVGVQPGRPFGVVGDLRARSRRRPPRARPRSRRSASSDLPERLPPVTSTRRGRRGRRGRVRSSRAGRGRRSVPSGCTSAPSSASRRRQFVAGRVRVPEVDRDDPAARRAAAPMRRRPASMSAKVASPRWSPNGRAVAVGLLEQHEVVGTGRAAGPRAAAGCPSRTAGGVPVPPRRAARRPRAARAAAPDRRGRPPRRGAGRGRGASSSPGLDLGEGDRDGVRPVAEELAAGRDGGRRAEHLERLRRPTVDQLRHCRAAGPVWSGMCVPEQQPADAAERHPGPVGRAGDVGPAVEQQVAVDEGRRCGSAARPACRAQSHEAQVHQGFGHPSADPVPSRRTSTASTLPAGSARLRPLKRLTAPAVGVDRADHRPARPTATAAAAPAEKASFGRSLCRRRNCASVLPEAFPYAPGPGSPVSVGGLERGEGQRLSGGGDHHPAGQRRRRAACSAAARSRRRGRWRSVSSAWNGCRGIGAGALAPALGVRVLAGGDAGPGARARCRRRRSTAPNRLKPPSGRCMPGQRVDGASRGTSRPTAASPWIA